MGRQPPESQGHPEGMGVGRGNESGPRVSPAGWQDVAPTAGVKFLREERFGFKGSRFGLGHLGVKKPLMFGEMLTSPPSLWAD